MSTPPPDQNPPVVSFTIRQIGALLEFLQSEAAGGLILMAAAALAILVANSPLGDVYFGALHAHVAGLEVLHWINDGLMAVFFLLVGLEIKREMVDGQLASWKLRALPGIAAAGGMLVPALIYAAINGSDPTTLRGWAIPSATDIAFALGVLALLGPRVPPSLRAFLAALAIIDDLGAVLIIAVFYTAGLSLPALGLAALVTVALVVLNRRKVYRLTPYLVLGVVLWALMLKSGVHATIAGVVLALTIPIRRSSEEGEEPPSPLHRLEHALNRWVAFGIVPLFGFANAGLSFAGASLGLLLQPVPLGIALGLFLGKQAGVFAFAWLSIRLGLADPPAGATAAQLYGVCVLCGIGFTMSLFIGLLAFSTPALLDATKFGVLAGSLASALVGWTLLRLGAPARAGTP